MKGIEKGFNLNVEACKISYKTNKLRKQTYPIISRNNPIKILSVSVLKYLFGHINGFCYINLVILSIHCKEI